MVVPRERGAQILPAAGLTAGGARGAREPPFLAGQGNFPQQRPACNLSLTLTPWRLQAAAYVSQSLLVDGHLTFLGIFPRVEARVVSLEPTNVERRRVSGE